MKTATAKNPETISLAKESTRGITTSLMAGGDFVVQIIAVLKKEHPELIKDKDSTLIDDLEKVRQGLNSEALLTQGQRDLVWAQFNFAQAVSLAMAVWANRLTTGRRCNSLLS